MTNEYLIYTEGEMVCDVDNPEIIGRVSYKSDVCSELAYSIPVKPTDDELYYVPVVLQDDSVRYYHPCYLKKLNITNSGDTSHVATKNSEEETNQFDDTISVLAFVDRNIPDRVQPYQRSFVERLGTRNGIWQNDKE